VTTQSKDLSLEIDRVVNASPERTFQAWIDPHKLQKWFAPSEEMTVDASVDLRVGGKYRVAMGEFVVEGEYHEVVRPKRLVFTWQWTNEPASNEMLVTIDFSEHPRGTRIRLEHTLLANEDARTQHQTGWDELLARLETLFADAD